MCIVHLQYSPLILLARRTPADAVDGLRPPRDEARSPEELVGAMTFCQARGLAP